MSTRWYPFDLEYEYTYGDGRVARLKLSVEYNADGTVRVTNFEAENYPADKWAWAREELFKILVDDYEIRDKDGHPQISPRKKRIDKEKFEERIHKLFLFKDFFKPLEAKIPVSRKAYEEAIP